MGNMNETKVFRNNFDNATEPNAGCVTYAYSLSLNNIDKKYLSVTDKIILDIGIVKCKISEIKNVINNIESTLLKDVPRSVHPL